MTGLPLRRLAALVALSFGLTFVTSALEPALIGNRIIAVVADPAARAVAFGAVTFSGLLVAMFSQPVIGALSDRTHTRLGRRVPFILAGVVLIACGLLGVATASSLAALILALLLTQLGVNSALAAWQPVFTERVSESQRGLATGIKAALDLCAALSGRLLAGEIVARYDDFGARALIAAAAAALVVLAAAAAVTVRAMGVEQVGPASMRGQSRAAIAATMRGAYRVDLRAHPAFARWFVNRMLFWAGVIGASAFLLFAAVDVYGMQEAEAQRAIARLAAALGLAIAIAVLPAGWLSDRVGRRPMIVLAGACAAAGAALILIDRALILPASVVIGLGAGAYLSASLALINDIVPRDEAARYLGVANIATAGGSALARLGGGALISAVNAATGTGEAGYLAMYAVVAALFASSAVVMLLPAPGLAAGGPQRVGARGASESAPRQ